MAKVICIAGFKGGVGKSTIANLLAEMLDKSLVISLDFMQDAEEYNSSKTVNLPRNTDITSFINTQNDSDYFIIDAGGFDDERLDDVEMDLLILPTKSGYRSIKTTVDSAVTFTPTDVPVMFILNDYLNEKELDESVEILEEIISVSDLGLEMHFFGIPHSNAIKSSENKNAGLHELAEQNKLMAHAYRKIIGTFKELAIEVKSIVGE